MNENEETVYDSWQEEELVTVTKVIISKNYELLDRRHFPTGTPDKTFPASGTENRHRIVHKMPPRRGEMLANMLTGSATSSSLQYDQSIASSHQLPALHNIRTTTEVYSFY